MPWRLIFIASLCSVGFGAEPEVDPKELPRFPAVEAKEAAKTFVVREGFKVELAASEPNVVSPVALSFDEDGRMYVVEMRDYSEHRDEKLGRIRLLEDVDGDGLFEKSTIFAEGLAWPTAVICYGGGIFVGATPDILFLRDTNGDGKADERRVVFTGFGKDSPRLNVQQLLNSFQWGLDNRIHGANGGNGGTIEQVASGAPALRLGTRDFSLDPRTLVMRAETGGGQHGMSFDDFGRKFVSNNSSHIRMQVYEDRYVRGVTGISLPPGMVDIAREGPAAEVFRISPEEPWRTIRTRWRVAGQVPGPIEGGGRASGYFTGATGVTIYRGDAYPAEFRGNAFVGDAGGNLVHRKILEPNGVLFEAHRAPDELNREFIASRDTWFRPVQFANAPDGCLYVIDMYREVIEHPWSIPPNLKKLVDLDSGRERGRIWRIVPENFKRRPAPKLSKASSEELVRTLNHPNGWHCDTAARLLYERQDRDSDAVRRLADPVFLPKSQRVHSLAVLGGIKAWDLHKAVRTGLNDQSGGVVERALIWLEAILPEQQKALRNHLEKLATSTNARVRHQLAWTIAAVQPEEPENLLARIIKTDAGDPAIRGAVLVAAKDRSSALFELLLKDDLFLKRAGAVDFLSVLARQAPTNTLEQALARASALKDRAASFRLASAIAERVPNSRSLDDLFRSAEKVLETSPSAADAAAVQLLRYAALASVTPIFEKTFIRNGPHEVRAEAFRALASDPRHAAQLLWEQWSDLPTMVRQSTIEILLARNEGASLIIDALKASRITRADLTASQTQILRQHPNPAISRPALELLGKVETDRVAVIERLRPALQKQGDPRIGEKIFTERCATCHRFLGKGAAVGPDLESVRGNGREYLLTHLLDPNREINTRYTMFVAELRDGDSVSGIIARETDGEVTLRMANAEEKTIARSELKSLKASAQSLMPVGLEEGLGESEIAGLLDYLGKGP
jgi:putative membrane-bound dehydrogenase-like protein